MNVARRLLLARILALLAVITLPAFVWIGWWQIGVSLILGTAAAILVPRPAGGRLDSTRKSSVYRTLSARGKSGGRRRGL